MSSTNFFNLPILFFLYLICNNEATAQNIVGLSYNGFERLNIKDSSYTILNSAVNTDGSGSGNSTYDYVRHHYIYLKDNDGLSDPNSFDTLVILNTINGSVIGRILFPNNTLQMPQLNYADLFEGFQNISALLYPNPFLREAIIEVNAEFFESGNLIIYSISGEIVKQMNLKSGKNILDKGTLSSGLYYFNIVCSNKVVWTGKLLIE